MGEAPKKIEGSEERRRRRMKREREEKPENNMDITTKGINIPQEGSASGGESLLPSTSGSSSKGSGGSRVHGQKEKSAKRAQRDADRASAWRAKHEQQHRRHERPPSEDLEPAAEEENTNTRKKTVLKTEDPVAGPSEETSPKTTWARQLWVRGSTLFRKRKTKKKEGTEDQALPTEEVASQVDPAVTYRALEETYQLSRIEESGNLDMALRHITRNLHPNGESICYKMSEDHDIMQLLCVNLPDDPEELLTLVERAYARRGRTLNRERVYRNHVRANGRVALDIKKQFPDCYYKTWQP